MSTLSTTSKKVYIFVIYASLFSGTIAEKCVANYGDPCDFEQPKPCCNHKNLMCKVSVLTNVSICVEIDHLGMRCRRDLDCRKINYAICSDNFECTCKNDYVNKPYSSTCVPLLDAFCEDGEECAIDNSICVDNTCQCKDRYFKVFHDQCKPVVLGLFCRKNKDCSLIPNAECSENNECVCKPDYIAYNSLTCRLRIGKICDDHTDCLRNAKCFHNKCDCGELYLPGLNDECAPSFTHLECMEAGNDHSKCNHERYLSCLRDGTCFCETNHIVLNETLCAPLLNEKCSISACAIDNSECRSGVCLCKQNFVAKFQNHCIPRFMYGPCKTDFDCSEIRHARCLKEKICGCKKGYISSSMVMCISASKGYCAVDEDCIVENTICMENQCVCKHDFGQISDSHCLPLITNSYCKEDRQCSHILNAKCTPEQFCGCTAKYTSVNNTVFCAPVLDGECKGDNDCLVKNAMCQNSVCQCKLWHYSVTKSQCEPSILGRPCNSFVDCMNGMTNAVCSESRKICICDKNYFFENGTCMPGDGEHCLVDDDCLLENFVCFRGQCRCIDEFIAESQFQCRPFLSTSLCQKDLECGDPWHSKCTKTNFCKCKQNHILINNVTCASLLDGLCWKESQCIVENSWCDDFHCKCRAKYQAVSVNYCKLIYSE